MATKKKRRKATRRAEYGKPTAPPHETPDQRLGQALSWALMTRSQLAFHLKLSPGRIETWWPSIGMGRDMHLAIGMAHALRVDPRWLLLGLPSPAGAAAAEQFARLITGAGASELLRVQTFLRTTPEPDRGAGVCRYCGCTEACGCAHGSGGSCWWVDAAATICSACLEPGDE